VVRHVLLHSGHRNVHYFTLIKKEIKMNTYFSAIKTIGLLVAVGLMVYVSLSDEQAVERFRRGDE